MVVPVVVLRAVHLVQAYRPADDDVKRTGTDDFESGVRLSWTPYGVPFGATQMLCASP